MEVINYEAGLEATWADDQFHTQLSRVLRRRSTITRRILPSTVVGLNNPTNRNAETESDVWGIEFSGQARFGGFSLDFGMAYMDSELGTFSDIIDPFRPAAGQRRQPVRRQASRSRRSSPATSASPMTSSSARFTLTPRVDYSHQDETQAALWDTPMETLEGPRPGQCADHARTGIGPMVGGALEHEPDE